MESNVVVRKETRPGILGKRGEQVLKAVYFYRYMTALDVCMLSYSPASLIHIRSVLTELAGGGDYVGKEYLYRFPLQRGVGNRMRVYTLGSRGRDFLKSELDMPVSWYFRPEKVRNVSVGQMMHNLCLTRFLVAAKVWCEKVKDFRLAGLHTCYEVGSDYPSVEMVKGEKRERVRVIPDAWMLFEQKAGGDRVAYPLLIEVDRGTAYKVKFKEHIASRVEFIKRGGVYSRLFGREEVMVVYVTVGETREYMDARRKSMCSWAMDALQELRKESWGECFRFGSISYEEMYGGQVFEDRVWYAPGSEVPVALFEG
jgi:hypothetical protein